MRVALKKKKVQTALFADQRKSCVLHFDLHERNCQNDKALYESIIMLKTFNLAEFFRDTKCMAFIKYTDSELEKFSV